MTAMPQTTIGQDSTPKKPDNILTLRVPIQGHETITQLVFKPPRGKLLFEYGVPVRAEGDRFFPKHEVMLPYISDMTGVETLLIESMDYRDLMDAMGIVMTLVGQEDKKK